MNKKYFRVKVSRARSGKLVQTDERIKSDREYYIETERHVELLLENFFHI